MADALNTTLDGLRAILNPLSNTIYQTADYGGGQWYYDPLDNSIDNTGTIVTNPDGKVFKRIYEGAVHSKWFQGSGMTDTESIKQAISNIFAITVTFANGVPIESMSKMLGHTDTKTTQHHAKILDLNCHRI